MKRIIFIAGVLLAVSTRQSVAAPTAFKVYDVTEYGADNSSCSANTEGIQAAIDAAHLAGGGTVYIPAGSYCVNDELLGYPNITIRGATLGVVDASSATVISTPSNFGAGKAVFRMANRTVANYGFQLEDLSIVVTTSNAGIVAVDFSGVWYGAIRGVAVSGGVGADPRHVLSSGSIGFLFSDKDGDNAGYACFANLVERTSVNGMDTAYRFNSTQGNESLITVTNFWTADVMTGIWTSSIGGVGLTFRDGYLATGLQVSGRKAFKHTGGYATITTQNVMFEFFDAPNDLPLTSGMLAQVAGDAYVGGTISGKRFTPILSQADGYYCGSTAACPCRPGTYPPAGSMSFWASIPSGTALSAGANTFTYYTYYAQESPTAMNDVFFTVHAKNTANIGQPFSFSGTNSVTSPYGYSFQTYSITLFLGSAVTLNHDFTFFLEANYSTPDSTPGSCLYPPV